MDVIRSLVVTHYSAFGPSAAEKRYEKQEMKVSKEALIQGIIEWGFCRAKRLKKAPIHPPRDRRKCYGELIQIDGSPHPSSNCYAAIRIWVLIAV
jgi:hypothetical protein